MGNPLLKHFGGAVPMNHVSGMPGGGDDPLGVFLQQFQQQKNTLRTDPRQAVQGLIFSGQMSNEEFNRFAQMANQIRRFVP